MKNPLATGVLFTIFAATGVGLVLPGTLLPLLLLRWSMNDAQGGMFFFLFFVGSTSGALLARGSLPWSIGRGGIALAAGAVALVSAGSHAAFAAVAVYGLGLGIVMTSISLLQSRRFPATRAAQMARLNLAWAVGALVGPAVLLRVAVRSGIGDVMYIVAGFFVAMGLLAAVVVPPANPERPVAAAGGTRKVALPWLLLAAVPLATGVESSMGGWLTTYARRDGATLGLTVGAVSCFWAGMLLSRLLQSHARIAEGSQKAVLLGAPWLMSAAVVLVIALHDPRATVVGAFAAGFAAGPMYPLLLALVLRHGEAGNVVFVAGGVGGASLPLLTGLVSQGAGSLRAGLSVPLVASVVLAGLAWSFGRRLDPGN